VCFFATDMCMPFEFRSFLTLFIILFTGALIWITSYEDFFLPGSGKQITKSTNSSEANYSSEANIPVLDIQSLKFSNSCEAQLNVHARSSTERRNTSCDQECRRFRNVLLNWPPDKPKAAIYILAKGDRHQKLNYSLTLLYCNFLQAFDYPVIVFHETDSRDLLHRKVRKQHANIRLFFQEVQFDTPAHVNEALARYKIIGCTRFPVSYRHMCRFHAKGVYQQPILVGLDYTWRLDDDSQLLTSIKYDVFAFMKNHRLQYGYKIIYPDSRECTLCLWEAAKLYKKQRQIQSQYFDKWSEPHIFYNNFEISALSLWKSQQYQDYINYIDLLGGIYIHRWGDAPIKTIFVTLFLRKEDTHFFANFTYHHDSLTSSD